MRVSAVCAGGRGVRKDGDDPFRAEGGVGEVQGGRTEWRAVAGHSLEGRGDRLEY